MNRAWSVHVTVALAAAVLALGPSMPALAQEDPPAPARAPPPEAIHYIGAACQPCHANSGRNWSTIPITARVSTP